MRIHRLLSLMTLLLVGVLVLAACPGGGAPAAPAPAPTEAPAEAAPTEAPAEDAAPTEAPAAAAAPADGPTLTIWADDTRSPVLEELGAAFEAEYGVRIVVTQKAFGSIRDDLKVAGPAGEGPDIIIGAHDWLGELVENGLLAEIDLGDNRDQFLAAAVQAFTYDGTLYGMPYATENVAFVYNTDLVETPPATWSEVEELAAQLEADGVVAQGFIHQESDPYHFFPIMTAFGGYVFGLTEEGYDASDVGIDSEGSIAAATWLDGMYKAGHLKTGAAVNYDIMHAQFGEGEAAMMITGPWALPTIRESGAPYAATTNCWRRHSCKSMWPTPRPCRRSSTPTRARRPLSPCARRLAMKIWPPLPRPAPMACPCQPSPKCPPSGRRGAMR